MSDALHLLNTAELAVIIIALIYFWSVHSKILERLARLETYMMILLASANLDKAAAGLRQKGE